jgi:hypothetical protein
MEFESIYSNKVHIKSSGKFIILIVSLLQPIESMYPFTDSLVINTTTAISEFGLCLEFLS